MSVPGSTAIKLQAAACAGVAVVCLRLGAADRRAHAAAQAVHPAAPPARAVAAMAWPRSRTSCWTPTPTPRNWSTVSHTTRPGQLTSTIYARSSARAGKSLARTAPDELSSCRWATWGRSMFVELDTRHGDGLTVTLEWDRDTGQHPDRRPRHAVRRTDRIRRSTRQCGRRVSPPVQVRAMIRGAAHRRCSRRRSRRRLPAVAFRARRSPRRVSRLDRHRRVATSRWPFESVSVGVRPRGARSIRRTPT